MDKKADALYRRLRLDDSAIVESEEVSPGVVLDSSVPDAMRPENRRLFRSGASDYPVVLRRCSDTGRPPTVTAQGNLGLLDKTLLGFFCSVRAPGDAILKTYDLARALRDADVTLIGGFQSPMEKEFLDLLLRGSAPVVVCPARGLGNMRIPKSWKKPLDEERLLLLSFFDANIRRPTANIAARRNAYVATLADRLLIAHAEKGGKIETLCKEALTHEKPVFALDSPDNADLVELGVVPVRAEDLSAVDCG